MNMTTTEEVILKTDVLGRVKTPKERRETLLDKFEKSGLSGQKFAEVVGIKYQTFATWAQQRRRARGAYPPVKQPKRLRCLEAVVVPAPVDDGGKNALVLQLPGVFEETRRVFLHSHLFMNESISRVISFFAIFGRAWTVFVQGVG